MEAVHLPDSHVLPLEDRTFHHKIPSKPYSNKKFNFLVIFYFALLNTQSSSVSESLLKICSRICLVSS